MKREISIPARLVAALAIAACGNQANGPELTGESYTITWGPVTVDANVEGTQCIIVDLGNESAVAIHELHNTLSDISHHLVVYRDDAASEERRTPFDCTPFAQTLAPEASAAPLMITQRGDDLLTLPYGVAYSLAPHQFIRVEMHYLNATDTAHTATATVELRVGGPEQTANEASFLFIGTPDIELMPNQAATVGGYFTLPASLADAQFYAITGHTHRLGVNVTVDQAATRDGPRQPVYAPSSFRWSEPETVRHDPPFKVAPGGGFDFQCDYFNSTPTTVKFGESANAEMCFFWAYYFPSRGARMCVHSALVNPPEGVDVCCPADSGDTLSKFVCDKLAGEL